MVPDDRFSFHMHAFNRDYYIQMGAGANRTGTGSGGPGGHL